MYLMPYFAASKSTDKIWKQYTYRNPILYICMVLTLTVLSKFIWSLIYIMLNQNIQKDRNK